MTRSLFLVGLVLSSFAFAGAGHDHKVEMPKEFDTLKNLVGAWEGTAKGDGMAEEKATVSYALTSGGTAVIETLGAGTPHEMVSIYHKDGKTISMTHYCALGNAPQMPLKKAADNTLSFEMTKAAGVTSLKEPHMHGVTLTLKDDTLVQEWTHFEGGKKKGTAVFTFNRKKT